MSDTYASVIASLDPSLPLSPYSELATAGLRAGFETVYDVPMADIDVGAVASVVQDVVSTVAVNAIDSVSGIPIAGAVLQFIGTIVSGVLEAEANAERQEQIVRRQCQEVERTMRPVATGFAGSLVPADLLGWYLHSGGVQAGTGRVIPPVVSENGKGAIPYIGRALWLYGYGYPVNPMATGETTAHEAEDYEILKHLVEDRSPPGTRYGPTELRRKQFRTVASAITLTRSRRESDGGVTVWPVLLDLLLDQAPSTPPSWPEYLASHYVVRASGERPRVVFPWENGGILSPECALPHSRAGVARMIDDWRLTIDPIYVQDRERAAELRKQVDAEVRRIMRTLPASVQLRMRRSVKSAIARPSRARRVAVAGAVALGATALLRPDLVLAGVSQVRTLIRR